VSVEIYTFVYCGKERNNWFCGIVAPERRPAVMTPWNGFRTCASNAEPNFRKSGES
jgi:hypothetical protein